LSAEIIWLRDRREEAEFDLEIDLRTAIDVAIRDLQEIEANWGTKLALERLAECPVWRHWVQVWGPSPTGFFIDRLQEIQTMTVYVIADIKVTDDGWLPAYAASVHDIVHKHGGKYLSRSGNVKTLEGKPLDTTFIALLEFPSAEAVQAFATDPKYAPYAAARQAGSESRFQLIDDTDVAGTIPYLPKG